jgi:hypothetical protein
VVNKAGCREATLFMPATQTDAQDVVEPARIVGNRSA